MKKTKIIQLESKTIEVSKLPIIKYAELLKLIKELPKYLKDIDQQPGSDLLEQLPFLIGVALPDVINVIVCACDGQVTKEEVEQMGLDEVTEIVIAIVDVNNYSQVFDRIKKVMAHQQIPTEQIQKIAPTVS